MQQRNPIAVFFLTIVTFGIYGIVWSVKTKEEMKQLGADIPTAWLIIVPLLNLYWLWKYSQGVEKVTSGQLAGALAFVLLLILGPIGMAIVQSDFNKLGAAPVTAAQAPAGFEAPQPAQTFTPPAAAAASVPLQPDSTPSTPLSDPVTGFDAPAAATEPTATAFTATSPLATPAPSSPEEPVAAAPQPITDVIQPATPPEPDVTIPEPAFAPEEPIGDTPAPQPPKTPTVA